MTLALAAAADGWLAAALAAVPADREAAEAGVRVAYAQAGLPDPDLVTWCGSPREGALAAARLTAGGQTGPSVRASVRTRPWAAARAGAIQRLGRAGWAEHWAAAGARTWHLITDRLVTPLRNRLEAELSERLPNVRLTLLDAVHGQHDGAWLAAFEGSGFNKPAIRDGTVVDGTVDAAAFHQGALEEAAGLAGLAQVARSAGWWWPYERVVILTERPLAVHRDNLGRLHHGDGPALSYPDGWGVHAWRGMPIPAEVAAQLPHLTVPQIQAESNAEVRRVMLEHFGFERYLRECDAKQVHQDEYGVLWRVNVPGDEPLVMVEVVNATPEPDGTRRTYFLRVPPTVQTSREAVAWTFGLTPEEYAPLTQT
jgi:hypothetical protein